MTHLPDVQLSLRPGIIEFGWGHPDPALLPAGGLAQAAAHVLRHAGPAALAYGAEQGPGSLIAPLCAWLGRVEGVPPEPEQVFITGGVSHALDLLCTLLTRPGDTVLVESPVYHLALRIFRDHGLALAPVAGDARGLRPDALAAALATLRREGRTPRFLYTVPSFGNPSGTCLTAARRADVAEIAQAAGLAIIEDEVYRQLWYNEPPPPPLAAYVPGVIHLGSFAKILAPGLRLGWLIAAPEMVQRCALSGQLDSGGGLNHFAAHVAGAFIELGLLDEHVQRLRAAYRQRRDVLTGALTEHLPLDCTWTRPGGGFFLWLRLPGGAPDSATLLPRAEAAGVSYVPGARFCADGGGERFLRLAFSLLSPAEMVEGARRLRAVLGGGD